MLHRAESFLKTDSKLTGQDIPRLILNKKMHYRVNKIHLRTLS